MKKGIVIGGGIAGLATAALLAKQGYKVTLLEKNALLGGRARVWEKDGFRFDMGPSWYQVPEAFEHFFQLFGKTSSVFYELVKLDPQYKVFTTSHKPIPISPVIKKTLEVFRTLDPKATRIEDYLQFGAKQFRILSKYILYEELSWKTFVTPSAIREISQLRTWETLQSFVKRYTSDPLLQKILTYTCLFIGGSPTRLPALFSMLAYVDLVQGTYYPQGGISKVIEALEQLCKEHNVTILKDSPVEKIVVKNSIATAVKTSKKTYNADFIVSCADYHFSETCLLDKQWQTYTASYWKKATLSPSAFVVYLGISKKLKSLAHHNLYFSENWEDHFNNLYKTHTLPEDPSYYVSCPSVTDSSVAPKNCENLFVTVQIPAGMKLSEKMTNKYYEKIVAHFEKLTGNAIREHVVVKRIFTIKDFEADYNAVQGTALGLASTTLQSIFRPALKSGKIKNLYYAGQYTTPGPGMPMCLIAAEKAVRLVQLEQK